MKSKDLSKIKEQIRKYTTDEVDEQELETTYLYMLDMLNTVCHREDIEDVVSESILNKFLVYFYLKEKYFIDVANDEIEFSSGGVTVGDTRVDNSSAVSPILEYKNLIILNYDKTYKFIIANFRKFKRNIKVIK